MRYMWINPRVSELHADFSLVLSSLYNVLESVQCCLVESIKIIINNVFWSDSHIDLIDHIHRDLLKLTNIEPLILPFTFFFGTTVQQYDLNRTGRWNSYSNPITV